MDPIYEKAKAEVADYDRQIAILQGLRDKALRLVSAYADYTGGAPVDATSNYVPLPGERTNTTQGRAKAVVYRILIAGPKPLPELLTAVESAGVKFGAQDKKQALSSVLSKDDRFAWDREKGWSLVRTP